jgi:hypothetical protein
MGATPNQISASLTSVQVTAALGAVTAIRTNIPFMIAQTPEERQKGFKLGDGTVDFLTKARSYAAQHPDWIPTEVSNTEWGKDADLVPPLTNIRNEVRALLADIEATLGEVGIEALDPSIKFYNNVHLKAKNDVVGAKAAYEDMKTQFPGRKSTPPAPPAP